MTYRGTPMSNGDAWAQIFTIGSNNETQTVLYNPPYTICWCTHPTELHYSPLTDEDGKVFTRGCSIGEASSEVNCGCLIFYPKECSETTYNRLNYAVHRGITIWKLWDAFEFQRRETKEN
jgi:hypothetical protein